MAGTFHCPETGQRIGRGVNIDILKHTVALYNLGNLSADRIRSTFANESTPRAQRIIALLDMHEQDIAKKGKGE